MKSYLLPFAVVVMLSGCAKKDEVTCYSSKQGNLQVKVIPLLNGGDVYSSESNPVKVMIGFDITDSKGNDPENYDRVIKARNNENWISCNNLNCGIFYFRVIRSETATGKTYSGGMSLITEQDTGQLEMRIELSEN